MSGIRRNNAKNVVWNVGGDLTVDGKLSGVPKEDAALSVLMDIRDEMQRLNALLYCHNFTDIPNILRGIRTKLPARKRKTRKKVNA